MNREQVAVEVLAGVGVAPAWPRTIAAVATWFEAEGGAGPQWGISGNIADFNPLNSTLKVPGSTGTPGNGAYPVQAYPDWKTGIAATVSTLLQANMSGIVSALKANCDCVTLSAAVAGSPWGTGAFARLCSAVTNQGPPVGHVTQLAAPVVGMVTNPTRTGYWLAGADGGVFAFGEAKWYGSMHGKPLIRPVVGIVSSATGAGYGLVGADGGVFGFGDFAYLGSVPGIGIAPA